RHPPPPSPVARAVGALDSIRFWPQKGAKIHKKAACSSRVVFVARLRPAKPTAATLAHGTHRTHGRGSPLWSAPLRDALDRVVARCAFPFLRPFRVFGVFRGQPRTFVSKSERIGLGIRSRLEARYPASNPRMPSNMIWAARAVSTRPVRRLKMVMPSLPSS